MKLLRNNCAYHRSALLPCLPNPPSTASSSSALCDACASSMSSHVISRESDASSHAQRNQDYVQFAQPQLSMYCLLHKSVHANDATVIISITVEHITNRTPDLLHIVQLGSLEQLLESQPFPVYKNTHTTGNKPAATAVDATTTAFCDHMTDYRAGIQTSYVRQCV
jgi:hypothetical protein